MLIGIILAKSVTPPVVDQPKGHLFTKEEARREAVLVFIP